MNCYKGRCVILLLNFAFNKFCRYAGRDAAWPSSQQAALGEKKTEKRGYHGRYKYTLSYQTWRQARMQCDSDSWTAWAAVTSSVPVFS